MRLAWVTDLHLDFAKFAAMENFYAQLTAGQPDAILITGDLGEANTWTRYAQSIEERIGKPVWFVLGNHDYYRSSIAEVRRKAKLLPGYLSGRGPVLLSEETALIGHDGWGDGRLGNYATSNVMLNDYVLIAELVSANKFRRLRVLHELGDEAAAHFRHWIPVAAERRKHIVIATHVPPFRDATWHEGHHSNDDWLPHFSCAAAGDALLEAADQYPEHRFTVLCGHTHGEGYVQMRPNLEVFTGGAVYGTPALQRVLEL